MSNRPNGPTEQGPQEPAATQTSAVKESANAAGKGDVPQASEAEAKGDRSIAKKAGIAAVGGAAAGIAREVVRWIRDRLTDGDVDA